MKRLSYIYTVIVFLFASIAYYTYDPSSSDDVHVSYECAYKYEASQPTPDYARLTSFASHVPSVRVVYLCHNVNARYSEKLRHFEEVLVSQYVRVCLHTRTVARLFDSNFFTNQIEYNIYRLERLLI